ncbi:MAG: hypothetical protein NT037_03955 [Hyphomicrobiales bacterium]|nr:hypothetical protein [Hyphomicrobiales bacterium]
MKQTDLEVGLCPDLPKRDRAALFGGLSLLAGLAPSADIDEAHVQHRLGHASADMTRHHQRRRDRSRVHLTKAAGL